MARPLRIQYPGAVYHVTSRGNAGQAIFKDDRDRDELLATLRRVTERFRWRCHAYCLMPNHYHLVIETPGGNLVQGMRQLNGVYTQSFNRRHARTGHVFQGRYKAILVQKESHLLEVCRYVVLNPVRAGLAKRPDNWKWSSYGGTSGIKAPDPCLTTEWVLGQFGETRSRAAERYRGFVQEGLGAESIRTKVKGQSLLGGEEFVRRLLPYVRGREAVKEFPRSERYVARPSLAKLFSARVLGTKARRDRAIAAAVERFGYTQKAVADFLGLHYSTISRLANAPKQEMSRFKT
jgi:REP element-mobilizing transposase RayT